VDRLNAELKKAVSVPEVAKILSSQTLDPMHMTPEQFAERLRSDYAKYERVIKASGASID
jgi:tripartite-type tricarboxylate transporter receptor subunit TctC